MVLRQVSERSGHTGLRLTECWSAGAVIGRKLIERRLIVGLPPVKYVRRVNSDLMI